MRRRIIQSEGSCAYRAMMSAPKTKLAKEIAGKWFNTLERLSEVTGVPVTILRRAVAGHSIRKDNEEKIYAALAKL